MDEQERARLVARQNDQFRKWWLSREGVPEIPGRALLTQGVQGLLLDLAEGTQTLLDLIAKFENFGEDNDPWGEHDFGAFDFEGARLFWKIDLYSDEMMTAGSQEPTNPAKTYRLMTIMLASEY